MSEVVDIGQAVKAYNSQSMTRTARWFQRIGAMLGVSQDGKRDVYDVYGYPADLGGDAGFQRMWQYSGRQGVANRITHGVPKSCWRDGFELRADPEDEKTIQAADELRALADRGLVRKLERADTLARIGRFSVLLVGIPDGRELHQPAGKALGSDPVKRVYFQPYAYDGVEILEYDNDTRSPRYGLPLLYQLQRTLRDSNDKDMGRVKSLRVHHSRVVHLVENALDSDIEGLGALEPVFNRILDLEKATGGASEAYFRNARGKTGYEIDPNFAADLLNDPTLRAKFDEGAEKFTNEWQDHTVAAGAKVKSLPTPHYSPLDTVKVSLWEVSAYTGIPLRVLTGEGAGQLAGSEDQLAYNHLVADRQTLICVSWVQAVLQVLGGAGVLEYKPEWYVVFPPQQASTEAQEAEVGNKRADTLHKVMSATAMLGGDRVDLDSAFTSVGLSGIKLDDLELPADEPPELEPEPEPEE